MNYLRFKFLYMVSLYCLLVVILLSCPYAKGEQVIDKNFEKFLLTQQDVQGYKLKMQRQSEGFPISDQRYVNEVEQEWVKDRAEVLVSVIVLDSEEEAMRGMHYHTGTTASVWYWNTFDGHLLGAFSWRADEQALLFSYGNVGVMARLLGPRADKRIVENFARLQLEKIVNNLSPEILEKRDTLTQSQIPTAEYEQMVNNVANNELKSFNKVTPEDSSWWPMKDTGLRMGIRTEWENDQGEVIGIDICKLESHEMAEEAAAKRAEMSGAYIVSAPSNPDIISNALFPRPWSRAQMSMVFIIKTSAIHIYNYCQGEADKALICALVEKIAAGNPIPDNAHTSSDNFNSWAYWSQFLLPYKCSIFQPPSEIPYLSFNPLDPFAIWFFMQNVLLAPSPLSGWEAGEDYRPPCS